MSERIHISSNFEDLQIRLMQKVAAAIEDVSTELCIREGEVPVGPARIVFSQMIIRNLYVTILKLLGTERACESLAKIIVEAQQAVAEGTSVGVPRPTEPR